MTKIAWTDSSTDMEDQNSLLIMWRKHSTFDEAFFGHAVLAKKLKEWFHPLDTSGKTSNVEFAKHMWTQELSKKNHQKWRDCKDSARELYHTRL